MKETAQQYVHRIVGNLNGKDPLKIQKSTAKKLHKIIKPLGKKELKRKPGPDDEVPHCSARPRWARRAKVRADLGGASAMSIGPSPNAW